MPGYWSKLFVKIIAASKERVNSIVVITFCWYFVCLSCAHRLSQQFFHHVQMYSWVEPVLGSGDRLFAQGNKDDHTFVQDFLCVL